MVFIEMIRNLSWSLNVLLLRVLPWCIHTNGQWLKRYLEKTFLVQWTLSYKELWRGHRILFVILADRKSVEKIKKLMFSKFCIFSYTVFAFQTTPLGYRFEILFMVAILPVWKSLMEPFCENSQRLLAVPFFRKKLLHRCSSGFWTLLWIFLYILALYKNFFSNV